MSRRSSAAPAPRLQPGLVQPDRRLRLMVSLVAQLDLGEEWDRERLLIIPRPGGRLTGRDRCLVVDCLKIRCGGRPLCDSHVSQFARSGLESLDAWLAEGSHPISVCLPLEHCVVQGSDGSRCGRPIGDPQGLCDTHSQAWHTRRRKEATLEEFLASARPLPAIGPCVVAACFLDATNKTMQLCRVHYVGWLAQGRPTAGAFRAWAARARQPVSGTILSLRGLPELVRSELLYGIGCRVEAHMATEPWHLRRFVDFLRASGAASLTEVDLARFSGYDAYPRFVIDRVQLAYADPAAERQADRWDLRVFGHRGNLDFRPIRQVWLREAAKAWAASALTGSRSAGAVRSRVQSLAVLSAVLASGAGGGDKPAKLGRSDIERFLARARSLKTLKGRSYSPRRLAGIVDDVALVLQQAREAGMLPDELPATFAVRRTDRRCRPDDEPGRALPVQVVATLDSHLDLLRGVPGSWPLTARRVLGERAGEMVVLVYRLLKGTGRRSGEVGSLHLDCLETDSAGRPVLVYDNHKRQRMGRRLPIADAQLVEAIRDQQSWVRSRFSDTDPAELWLLPRPSRNSDGRAHISSHEIWSWITTWVGLIPSIEVGPAAQPGRPMAFDRSAIHPHAFRHTYAQTLADQGVPAPVLRDLMDHRSIDTTLGYYRVADARKREAMELLARHTIDNRGLATRIDSRCSPAAQLAEEISWVAVPMGKCAEPTNVRAGGQACPIRYQCAGCPHFESDPSFLPELRAYADELRREREAMLAAGAADWAVEHVSRQLEVIVGHVSTHEVLLCRVGDDERAVIEEASLTLRKARQFVPVAFGRRRAGRG
jgi:integrase